MNTEKDFRDVSEALIYVIAALEQQERFCRRSWGRSKDCPSRDALAAVADDIAECRARLESRLKAVRRDAAS